MSSLYDYIIIGSGVAGLSSAQYSARSGLKTLVLDVSNPGGQAINISYLENYPGIYPAISGAEFINTLEKQTRAFGAEIKQTQVHAIDKIGRTFSIKTANGTFTSYALLIATGAIHKPLGIPGEKELLGAGVSYCATCDGPFFKNKKIVVIGGGDSACSEAIYLASLSSSVTLIHRRDTLRAQKAIIQQVEANSHITVLYNTVVSEIQGATQVTGIETENVKQRTHSHMDCDAVFIFAGMSPRTTLVSMLKTDEEGYIITNYRMETPIQGLYCAGDVRAKPFRQLITAAADGAIAAHQAQEYIHDLKHTDTGADY
ncbi:MAG: thioredoxin-disulfide reductase [Treponema sp.]|nr:thioredoxin-disulfide reductase [Treponema sp.]